MTINQTQDDFTLTSDITLLVDPRYHTFPELPERCTAIAPDISEGVLQCTKTGGHRSDRHRNGSTTWTEIQIRKLPTNTIVHVTHQNAAWASFVTGRSTDYIRTALAAADLKDEVCLVEAL